MNLPEEFEGARFLFRKQPVALPPDLRPIWRISVLLLILHRCCRQKRASLNKLHVLSWAIRTSQSRQTFLDVFNGVAHPDKAVIRFDPAMNRALDLVRGENLVQQIGGDHFQITTKGTALSGEIESDDDLMRVEKWFLGELGSNATETRIKKLMRLVT